MFIQRKIYGAYREKLLDFFSDLGPALTFKKRQVIELSGGEANYVYLIRKGCVRQYFDTPVGEAMILLLLSSGDLFNEITLFNGDGNCVVSMAHTDTEVLKIPADVFWKKTDQDPEIYKFISYQIAYKLRVAMALLYDLSFSSTAERLRSLLVRLCIQLGEPAEDRIRIPYHFTHEEYAQMISASRSTVSRLLKSFEDAGYLHLEGRCAEIYPSLQDADFS